MANHWLTEEDAARILASPVKNAETYRPRMFAGRRLMPVVTARELELFRMRAPDDPTPAPTFSCSGCGKFAFNAPTTCYWCRRGRA